MTALIRSQMTRKQKHASRKYKESRESLRKIAMYKCSKCKKKFNMKLDRAQHEQDEHGTMKKKKCNKCHRKFECASEYYKHYRSAHMVNQKMKLHLGKRMDRINLSTTDKKHSQARVKNFLDALGDCFADGIFSKTFVTSGSYSTDTKIRKADEFDYDVLLKYSLEEINVRREGRIHYYFRQRQKTLSLNVKMHLHTMRDYDNIPSGYAEVWTDGEQTGEEIVHPRKIHEELYKDMQCAVNNLEDVHLNRMPQGPAVTVMIKTPGKHDISLDVSPSIKTNQVHLHDYKWPRPATQKVLDAMLIKIIEDAGLHLIPKKIRFWYISASNAGKILMKNIDAKDSGCRRWCHKLMKDDFKKWWGRSKHNLEGMSTMIFKQQLFWFNEENPQLNWQQENICECYLKMLKDLSKRLRAGKLFNYFRDVENLLRDKRQEVLNQVANLADQTREELEKMESDEFFKKS